MKNIVWFFGASLLVACSTQASEEAASESALTDAPQRIGFSCRCEEAGGCGGAFTVTGAYNTDRPNVLRLSGVDGQRISGTSTFDFPTGNAEIDPVLLAKGHEFDETNDPIVERPLGYLSFAGHEYSCEGVFRTDVHTVQWRWCHSFTTKDLCPSVCAWSGDSCGLPATE